MKDRTWVVAGMTVGALVIGVLLHVGCTQNSGTATSVQGPSNTLDSELGLTPEQRKKMREIRSVSQAKATELQGALRTKRDALDKELSSPSVTLASVAPLVSEINSLQAQLLDTRINRELALKEIFTPEQFATYQAKEAARGGASGAGGGVRPGVSRSDAPKKQ